MVVRGDPEDGHDRPPPLPLEEPSEAERPERLPQDEERPAEQAGLLPRHHRGCPRLGEPGGLLRGPNGAPAFLLAYEGGRHVAQRPLEGERRLGPGMQVAGREAGREEGSRGGARVERVEEQGAERLVQRAVVEDLDAGRRHLERGA